MKIHGKQTLAIALLAALGMLGPLQETACSEPTLIARVTPGANDYIATSPNGRHLLIQSVGKAVTIIELSTRKRRLFRNGNPYFRSGWTPDNRVLVCDNFPPDSVSQSVAVITSRSLVDESKRRYLVPVPRHPRGKKVSEGLRDWKFSPDGSELVLLFAWYLRVYDAKSGRLKRSLLWNNKLSRFSDVALTADCRFIVCARQQIQLYDARDGRVVRRFGAQVEGLYASVNPRIVQSFEAFKEGEPVKRTQWDVQTGKALWSGLASGVPGNDGKFDIESTKWGLIWRDLQTGLVRRRTQGPSADMVFFWPTSDGKYVYSLEGDGRVLRWSAR